jgi:hypothetical protein
VSPAPEVNISDYWTPQEQSWDISVKEAVALKRVLLAVQEHMVNARVDALVNKLFKPTLVVSLAIPVILWR